MKHISNEIELNKANYKIFKKHHKIKQKIKVIQQLN